MYKAKLNDKTLYHPNAEDDKKIIEGKFTESLNKSGTFEFTVNQDNVAYSQAQKMRDHVYLYRYTKPGKEKLLFEGRLVSDTKDFDNLKTVTCEGALGYLLDSRQRPYTYQHVNPRQLFENLISAHNESVQEDRRFVIGVVDVEGNETTVTENGYPNTFDDIEDKLINVYGGYVSVRYADGVRYIDYKKDSGRKLDKPIRFGVNMMDLEEVIDAGDIKTVLIPIGNDNSATGKPITIKSVNNDIDYLENKEAIRLFGRIEGTLKVESDSPRTILEAGQEEIESISNMTVSIEVTAVDLADTGIDIEDVHAGDWIPVISRKHGINSVMQITSREVDILNPEKSKIALGASIRTLTRTQDQEEHAIRKEMTSLKESSDSKTEEVKNEIGRLEEAQDDLRQSTEESIAGVKEEVDNAKNIAESTQEQATIATEKAEQAAQAAENAQNYAESAKQNADTANTNAAAALTKAETAVTDANSAMSTVNAINTEIANIKSDQTAIRNEMAAEIETVTKTAEATYAKQDDVSSVEATLRSEISESVAEVSRTMESDYAKKTELTDVQSNLQTQISQNSEQITSTASAVETIKVDASDAKTKAESAVTTATEAQTKAQTAVTAAEAAQADATAAQTEADTAKKAAADAQTAASTAQADLDAAKKNLEEVSSKADATAEEVAAAQAAVDTAQKKADEANASAAAAQAAADEAQATADTATANAAAAQTAADEAKAEADKANVAVGNLANTVTDMQTQISQNAEEIELRATKTEVSEYLSGYSTKEETESAINLASASIRAEVNASIGAISGGDNILRGTNVEKELVEDGTWTTGQWKLRGTGTATSYTMTDSPVSSLNIAWTIKGAVYPAKYGGIQQTQITIEPGTYTVSVWAKNTSADSTLSAQLAFYLGNSKIGSTISVGKNWGRYSATFSAETESITIAFYNPSSITSTDICGMTLNKGETASPWTPSTFDIGDDLTAIRASLELKVDKTSLISEINASANVITLTGNRFVVNSDNFQLAEDGTMKATNAEFSGKITSSSGTIGGFAIDADALTYNDDSFYMGLNSYKGIEAYNIVSGAVDNNSRAVLKDGGIYVGSSFGLTTDGTVDWDDYTKHITAVTKDGIFSKKDIVLTENNAGLYGVGAIPSGTIGVAENYHLIGVNADNNVLVGFSATGDAREGNTQIYATNGYVRLIAGNGNAVEEVRLAYNDANGFRFSPTEAGKGLLGSTTYYFNRVYASVAQWTPSDKRKKTNIRKFDERFEKMYDELEPILYELIESRGQSHFGMIAQDVEAVMNKYEIEPSECGFFEYDSENDVYGLVYQELAVYNAWILQKTRQELRELRALI